MRRFTIDSTVLGTSKHIVGDSDGYVWSESVPKDSWHMTGETKTASTVKCLDTLFRLSNEPVPHVPDRYLASLRCLVTGSQAIPWRCVLPQDEFKNYFKNLVQKTTDVFDELPFDYYETVWAAGTRVLNSLKPAKLTRSREFSTEKKWLCTSRRIRSIFHEDWKVHCRRRS